MFRVYAAILALIATGVGGTPAAAKTLEEVMEDLSQGGKVILMRHANSPTNQPSSVGMTDGCVLQSGRGLDAKGFFQARFIGEFLEEAAIPIGAAYTSDMCRTWDTARLVASRATIDTSPALKSTSRGDIDLFKTQVSAMLQVAAGQNVLLVTHSNIVPLFADWSEETEIPSGVILLVDPADWSVTNTLNLDFDLSVGAGGPTR